MRFGTSHVLSLTYFHRRARNRLSQRAYRRRHAERLRELRERAEAGTTSPNEILEKTRKENQLLRKQLCDVQSKLASVTESLMTLAGSVTNVLNENSPEQPPFQGTRVDPSVEPNETTAETDILNPGPVDSTLSSDWMINEIFQPSSATPVTYPPETFSLAAGPATSSAGLDWEAMSGNPSVLCHQQIPNIWSYGYQMGFQPYARALAGSESSSLILRKPWVESNSAFSDHISVLLQLLKTNTGPLELQWNRLELYRIHKSSVYEFTSLIMRQALPASRCSAWAF